MLESCRVLRPQGELIPHKNNERESVKMFNIKIERFNDVVGAKVLGIKEVATLKEVINV
jgi:hypothetical protein